MTASDTAMSADMTTRYFTETGQPLLTSRQAAELAGVKYGTIRQWDARGHLQAAGLDECGRKLYAACDVLAVRHRLRGPGC